MANILVTIAVDVEKGLSIAAEDVLKAVGLASSAVASSGPGALAAFGVLMGALDKAVTDVEAGAVNPTSLVVAIPPDLADIKAVWPAIVAFLATIGVKV